MDFLISDSGDLKLEGGYIETISDIDSIRNQIAMCKLVSVSHDWFYDNIGSNLEQLIGMPMNAHTLDKGKELIFSSLLKDGNIIDDEVVVESVIVDLNSIGYNVFIRQARNNKIYIMFSVVLDLIKGVYVKLEGDISVNIK